MLNRFIPSFFPPIFFHHLAHAESTYYFFWSILGFCVKRCILRTFIICLMVFIGETIPKFSNILALVGGSTITLATFVLPPYLYMKICDQNGKWVLFCFIYFLIICFSLLFMSNYFRQVPLYEKAYMWELILVGIVGGIASSYSAIEVIINDPLSKPCYWPYS